MLNQLLVGRYLVTDVLGEGGLAKTYIARDRHLPSQPQCVVKILKPASRDSSFLDIARRLFNTEAKILQKLGVHNQIPQLLAYFEENKEFFIIQEYIEGHTLDTELPSGHRWTENKTILMLQDVLSTLEFVHDSQVIHRDLKPNNLIRRNQDGKIVLIDFGAVKQVGDARITTKVPLTPNTIAIGTQGYMPVEQARGKPKLNSDIYSLGMTAIQAVTGIDPYHLEEGYDGEIIWRRYAQVSDKLANILNRMVRYDFRHRYQTVKEVQQAIASLNQSVALSLVSQDKPKSGLRETRVSLNNPPVANSIVTPAAPNLEASSGDSIKTFTSVESTFEPQETKVSLDTNNSKDSETIDSLAELPAESQQRVRDAWSAWNLDSNPSEVCEINSIETNQFKIKDPDLENREIAKNLDKEYSPNWATLVTNDKSELDNFNKPVKDDNLVAEPQTKSEELKLIEDSTTNQSLVSNISENNDTQLSLKNETINNHIDNSYQADPKETRPSFSKDINLVPKDTEKGTKVSLKIQESEKLALASGNYNETKVSIGNNIEINTSNTSKSTTNIFNNILVQLKQISLPINSTKLENISVLISQSALSTSAFLAKIKPNLSSVTVNKTPLFIGSGVALTCMGVAYFGYKHLQHQQEYSQARTALQEIESLKNSKKYQECIQQAQALSNDFADFNLNIATLLKDCSQGQLKDANKLAKDSRYKDAINLAAAIPPEQEVYTESQQLIVRWSKQIVKIATNKYHEGNLEQAIAILKAIPNNSPVTNNREDTIQQWQDNWDKNQSHIQAAQKSLDEQRWEDAIKEAEKVQDHKHWLKQSEAIIKQAEAAENSRQSTTQHYPTYYTREEIIERRLRCFDEFWQGIRRRCP